MNEKILVSADMCFFVERMALVQTLDWRNTRRDSVDLEGSSLVARTVRDASSREPMW